MDLRFLIYGPRFLRGRRDSSVGPLSVQKGRLLGLAPYPSVATTTNAAAPAMGAVLTPLLLGSVLSSSMCPASTHYISPSTVRSTALHRRRRRFPLLASAAESPSAPLPAASSSSNFRCSRWVVVMDRPPGAAGGNGASRAEAVDYYAATLAKVMGR
jgi:hypothetical protein